VFRFEILLLLLLLFGGEGPDGIPRETNNPKGKVRRSRLIISL